MKIAIVGCGQLARMLALKGWTFNATFSFIAEGGEATDCVEGLGTIVHVKQGMTAAQVYNDIGRPDVITVEREQVSVELLRELMAFCLVYPHPDVIAICQDRLAEKHALHEHGIPVAGYLPASNKQEILLAAETFGYPLFFKSRQQGYDGKNQWRIDSSEMLQKMLPVISKHVCVAEQAVDFTAEVSVIAVRGRDEKTAFYPLTENRHHNGILVSSVAPADKRYPGVYEQAVQFLQILLQSWNYTGVLSMELFVTPEKVLVNELAPRVHNSGHWSMNAAVTCQFENHLRAIAGLAIGSTQVQSYCGMVNLLTVPDNSSSLFDKNSHVYWYNKVPKPNRKLGHVNICGDEYQDAKEYVSVLAARLYPLL